MRSKYLSTCDELVVTLFFRFDGFDFLDIALLPFHLPAILSKVLYVHQPVYPGRSQNFHRVRVFTAVHGSQSRYTSNHMMRQHLYGSEEIIVRSVCTRTRWGDCIQHEHHSMEQRTIQVQLHQMALLTYENTPPTFHAITDILSLSIIACAGHGVLVHNS